MMRDIVKEANEDLMVKLGECVNCYVEIMEIGKKKS